jgi:hypothetical protein
MKLKGLFRLALLFTFVLVSYGVANSQIVDAAKDAADKTKNATVDAAKETSSGVKTFGNYTVKVTENVVGKSYEGGKWFVTTTWNRAKWVSKRVWYANKKDEK